MQITVFHFVHKEIDNVFSPGANYSFRESGLQISSIKFRKHSSFAYVISRIRNTNRKKNKYWTMFFNRIAVHMQNF